MATPGHQPSLDSPAQQPSSDSSAQVRELLTFLRQENAANQDYLNKQAESDRQLLKHTLWIVGVPLTVLIAVAGFFGFKSISDLKNSIRTQAETETKTEIARLKADTDRQIEKMQTDIRSRLDQQFQTPVIRGLVKDAAKEQTQSTAKPLIQGEVAKQVKNRINAEQENIRLTVAEQTQVAVNQMAPQIDKITKDAVDATVRTKLAPLEGQISSLEKRARVGDLRALMTWVKEDDAAAFDRLELIDLNSLDPDEQQRVKSFLKGFVEDYRTGKIFHGVSWASSCWGWNEEELTKHLSNSDREDRLNAMGCIEKTIYYPNKFRIGKQPGPSLKLLTKLVEMLQNDPSLQVRAETYKVFGLWAKQEFPFFDKQSVMVWWNQHGKELAR